MTIDSPNDGSAGSSARQILDSDEISRALTRMAYEILEANRGAENLVVLGIPTRGVALARRLAAIMKDVEDVDVPVGTLDITMYRDDLRANPTRAVGRSRIPRKVDGALVVLVDDVLYSGRTVVAAFDALRDLGRPRVVRLAVLVDRGHRELPVSGDYVGKSIPTSSDEHVRVNLTETDGHDGVSIGRGRSA